MQCASAVDFFHSFVCCYKICNNIEGSTLDFVAHNLTIIKLITNGLFVVCGLYIVIQNTLRLINAKMVTASGKHVLNPH